MVSVRELSSHIPVLSPGLVSSFCRTITSTRLLRPPDGRPALVAFSRQVTFRLIRMVIRVISGRWYDASAFLRIIEHQHGPFLASQSPYVRPRESFLFDRKEMDHLRWLEHTRRSAMDVWLAGRETRQSSPCLVFMVVRSDGAELA